jgi:hypothetical protein
MADEGEMTRGATDGGTACSSERRGWCVRTVRVAGAGLTGAVVGAVVAGIWHAGLVGANNAVEYGGDNFSLTFLVPMAAAIAGNVIVIDAGLLIGFAALRIRPLRLTVPVGFAVAALLAWVLGYGTPAGPPAWATAAAVGAGLAALALIVDWGKALIACLGTG